MFFPKTWGVKVKYFCVVIKIKPPKSNTVLIQTRSAKLFWNFISIIYKILNHLSFFLIEVLKNNFLLLADHLNQGLVI